MKKGLKFILAGAAGALPFVAFAQNIADIVVQLTGIINVFIPFIVGLAVLVIIWGVFGYISGAGDEEKRGEAKQYIIWGVIGVFIMLSIWGLVNVLVNSFNLSKVQPASPSVGAIIGGDCFKNDGTKGKYLRQQIPGGTAGFTEVICG